MKAVLCKAFGPPEALVVEDIAVPEPGPGEVRIRVGACALNFFDTLIIQNRYQYKPDLPFSPSAELAGTIDADFWQGAKRVQLRILDAAKPAGMR